MQNQSASDPSSSEVHVELPPLYVHAKGIQLEPVDLMPLVKAAAVSLLIGAVGFTFKMLLTRTA